MSGDRSSPVLKNLARLAEPGAYTQSARIVPLAATAVAVTGLVAWQLATIGLTIAEWDLLFVTGWFTVIVGLWLAHGQRRRVERLITRLANRGVLRGPDAAAEQGYEALLHDDIESRADRWASLGAFLLAALLAAAFAIVNARRQADLPLIFSIGGPLTGAIGGFVVGRSLGRLLSYGSVARSIFARGLTLRSQPGHVDGAAGLKPLGDFYFAQAGLIALPALFLLVWSFLFLIPPWDARYGDWRGAYLGFLALAICLQVIAFALPLRRVHAHMTEQKDAELEAADRQLARQITAARKQLQSELANDEREAIRDRLEYLIRSYEEIEAMPTWPVDRRLKRRLTLGNLALVIPLISQSLALAGRGS